MATDDFTVNNFATNWTVLDGGWSTSGGRAVPQNDEGNLAFWSAQGWNNGQRAQCKVYGASINGGPAVRVAATRGYYISVEAAQVRLFRLDSNENYNLIQDLSSTASDGDIFKIEVTGNSIVCR